MLALEVSSSFVLCSHRAQVFVRKMRTRLSMSNLDQWVAGKVVCIGFNWW